MKSAKQCKGPELLTVVEHGGVEDRFNDAVVKVMEDRHGVIHMGGDSWAIQLLGDTQADGLPEWGGEPVIDFEDFKKGVTT